jgi:hypothetical protein
LEDEVPADDRGALGRLVGIVEGWFLIEERETLQLTCFRHSIYYLAAVPGGFNYQKNIWEARK